MESSWKLINKMETLCTSFVPEGNSSLPLVELLIPVLIQSQIEFASVQTVYPIVLLHLSIVEILLRRLSLVDWASDRTRPAELYVKRRAIILVFSQYGTRLP
jgi:hypothetical protein